MIESRKFVSVEGLETCYFEKGTGPTVLLLHSGEHGGCSEICWEHNFDVLASQFHVIAPDWLGFGRSAKVHDFVLGSERRLLHLKAFLQSVGVSEAHVMGSSMGGTLALKALAPPSPTFDALSLTLIGAGGDSPDSAARRALIDYDCTFESMQSVVDALFHDPRYMNDDSYVQRRLDMSNMPGAWECASAARLKNPTLPERPSRGLVDDTDYKAFDLPILVIAGEQDKIKQPGYAEKIADRMVDAEVHVIPQCGHMPNIEQSSAVNDLFADFVMRIERRAKA